MPQECLTQGPSAKAEDGSSKRRRYLSSDSICWTIYDKEFEQDQRHPEVSPAEEIRKELLEVSTKLQDAPSDLCCICRCVDFGFFYSGCSSVRSYTGSSSREQLVISTVIPLGMVQDMDSDCSLCQLVVHSCEMTADMACFLCFELLMNRRPRLKLRIYELTSILTPAEEFFLSLSQHYDTSEPHQKIRHIRDVLLMKIGNGSTVALQQTSRVSGRVVASTVDLRVLRQFLESTGPDGRLASWSRRILSSSLATLMRTLAELPNITHFAILEPTKRASPPINGAMDDFGMQWKLSLNFRVIDVHRCCLVNPTRDVHFVALSYVWGKLSRPHLMNTKANCSDLYLPQAISPFGETLPRTVRDAMLATAGLGYKYLWVDALCIVQDDNEDKQDQIKQMVAVYRLASFTIVAAAGNDADAGLPGIASTPRPHWQYVFGNSSAKFANRGAHLEESIQSSRWLTRGWTYQEFALSSRLLIFTTHQAFFVDARYGNSLESSYFYHSESDVSRVMQRGGTAISFISHIVSKPLDALGIYENAIDTYSIRELTYQNDALNAFEGIASYLNQGFRSGFTFGLPIIFLEVGLLWFSYPPANGETHLRKGFPEYSWASRNHKVSMWSRPQPTWPSSRVLWRNFNPQRKKDWMCEDDTMPQPESEKAAKWRFIPKGTVIEVVSGNKPLSVTQPYWQDTEEHPSWQHARPILPTPLLPFFQPAEPDTGRLHFWSYVIRLGLERESVEDFAWVALSGQLHDDGLPFAGTKIGDFQMDGFVFPNPIDLVLLCCFESHNRLPYCDRSRHRLLQHDADGNQPSWHVSKFAQDAARVNPRPEMVMYSRWTPDTNYAVMAVQTIDGISYRRGIGTIDLSWFHKARPEERYIVLG